MPRRSENVLADMVRACPDGGNLGRIANVPQGRDYRLDRRRILFDLKVRE
jgi:hypothetical protein